MAIDRPRVHYPGGEIYKVAYEPDVTSDVSSYCFWFMNICGYSSGDETATYPDLDKFKTLYGYFQSLSSNFRSFFRTFDNTFPLLNMNNIFIWKHLGCNIQCQSLFTNDKLNCRQRTTLQNPSFINRGQD